MALFSLTGLAVAALNPRNWMYAIGVAVGAYLVFNIGSFVNTALEDRRKVVEQEVELKFKEREIAALETELEGVEAAFDIANVKLLQEQARSLEFQSIRNDILSAPPENDGDVPQVLQDTMNAIRERHAAPSDPFGVEE